MVHFVVLVEMAAQTGTYSGRQTEHGIFRTNELSVKGRRGKLVTRATFY
jgi:hypothetical protein